MYYYRRLPKFEYLSPTSIGEACAFLELYKGETRIMAGGTIVLHRMKERIGVRPYVMGMKRIPGLASIISDGSGGLAIGSMAGLQQIADSGEVKNFAPLLAAVCGRLGTPQIRNMGTLGGNVACGLATAESLPALAALSAKVRIATAAGEKVVLVEDLHNAPKDGGFITEILLPAQPPGARWGYSKFSVRERLDYATVAAAVVMTADGPACADIKIGLGGVAVTRTRARAAEDAIRGRKLSLSLIDEAATIASEGGNVRSDLTFSAEYKKKVLKVMVARAIGEAAGELTQ